MTEKSKDKKKEAGSNRQQAKDAAAELEVVVKERDAARVKADEYLDMARRLQAEFENYRKRTERNNEEFHKYATEGMVSRLLNVIDDLDRALGNADRKDPLAAGVTSIANNLRKVLEDEGVREISAEGDFDPEKHEAMMMVDGEEPGKIAAVYQKGYTMHDKVIRYSKVAVTKKQQEEPEKAEKPEGEPEKTE